MGDCCSNNNNEDDENVGLGNLDELICYCFKKSKKELLEAVMNSDESSIVDEIKFKMKNPGCFCDTANPSGKCCLTDVHAFIKATKNL